MSKSGPSRIRESLSSRLIVSLAVLLVGVVGVNCSGAANSATEETDDVGVTQMTLPEDVVVSSSYVEEAGDIGAVRYGGYTEEEIGVEMLIDSYFADSPLMALARYRTREEYREASVPDFGSSPEATDRTWFEQSARLLFSGLREVMPPDVEAASDALYVALHDSLDLCTERSPWPEIGLYELKNGKYYFMSVDQFDYALDRYELSRDDLLDFRHECHKFAASYPVLDPEHRDELLKTRRDYYLEFLRLWMADHPELVVPLDYENSVNQPYQDYMREVCMTSEDPEGCAREEGVSLP